MEDIVHTGWLIKSPPERKLRRYVSKEMLSTVSVYPLNINSAQKLLRFRYDAETAPSVGQKALELISDGWDLDNMSLNNSSRDK